MKTKLKHCKHDVWNMLMVCAVLILGIGCESEAADENATVIPVGYLEWQAETGGETLTTHVHFGIDDSEVQRVILHLNYTGDPAPVDFSGTFDAVELQTNAVIGEQVIFPEGMTTVIPAGSKESEPIAIDIDPTAIVGDEPLTLVLCITDEGDALPVPARSQYKITVTKVTNPLVSHSVELIRPGQSGSGLTLIDLAGLSVYSRNEALREPYIQQSIDFGFWNSSSKDFVFIVPTNDDRLNAWGSGRTLLEEWETTTRNDGILMKIPEDLVTPDLFDEVDEPLELIARFDDAGDILAPLDSYDYGPGGHIHNINEGDVIFFRSLSRNIHAVAKVRALVPGNSGSLELEVKTVVQPD